MSFTRIYYINDTIILEIDMGNYYKLVNKIPVECDSNYWSPIEKSKFGEILVSTVFLGFKHGTENDKPILFETLVFGGEYDGYMIRYTNWEDSVKGHWEVCDKVNKIVIDRERKLNDLN